MQHDCGAGNCKFSCRIFERRLTVFYKISKFEKLCLETVRYILAFHPSLSTTVITLSIFLTYLLLSAFCSWGKDKRNGGYRKHQAYFHSTLMFNFLKFLNNFEIGYLESFCSTWVSSCLHVSWKLLNNK